MISELRLYLKFDMHFDQFYLISSRPFFLYTKYGSITWNSENGFVQREITLILDQSKPFLLHKFINGNWLKILHSENFEHPTIKLTAKVHTAKFTGYVLVNKQLQGINIEQIWFSQTIWTGILHQYEFASLSTRCTGRFSKSHILNISILCKIPKNEHMPFITFPNWILYGCDLCFCLRIDKCNLLNHVDINASCLFSLTHLL